MEQGKWIRRLALEDQSLPGKPLMEILDDKRVLIEHHRGITQYTPERIQIRVKFGAICVCGAELSLCRMTADQLVITGRIDSLTLLRGD